MSPPPDPARSGRVANIEVHTKCLPRGREVSRKRHPHAGILILITDGLRSQVGEIEPQPLGVSRLQQHLSDRRDELTDALDVARQNRGREVDICGGSAQIVGSGQHTPSEPPGPS